MDFFFYTVIILLFLLFPIPIGGQGTFDADRRIICVKLKAFFIKIISLKLYFAEGAVYLSLNGKKGKMLSLKKKSKSSSLRFDPFAAIRIRFLTISLAIGGDPLVLSYTLGSMLGILSSLLSYAEDRGILDQATLRVIPALSDRSATVNFSIKLFTSIAMLLGAFGHTKRGEKDEKRSIGEYDG